MRKPAKKAAPVKHPVHPPPAHPTPAQRATARRRHVAAVKAAATRKKNAAKAKVKKPAARKLARPGPRGWWILGGNDVHDSCAATAVANSLLAVTGIRVTGADVLELYRLTGPASIEETLRAVLHAGIGGHRPQWITRLGSFADICSPGLVLGVDLEEPHAVTVAPGGQLITWGSAVREAGSIDEAWAVIWP